MKRIKPLIAVFGLLSIGVAQADYAVNLTEGVTELSRDIHDLHMLIFWICVAIGVLVYGLLIYSIINHRKSKGVVPATFHENTKLEIVWTVIPFLILLGMAVPATRVMIKAYDASGADLTIKVTGYQWKWRYEYLDDDISFFSSLDAQSNLARQLNSDIDPASVDHYLLNVDHPLVIPVGKKIRFLLTGADVIHAWWVPDLGWKKDTIPGFITDAWARVDKPGVYRGQCAELCGRDHGFMPIVVIAKPEAEYEAWLAEQKRAKAAAESEEDDEESVVDSEEAQEPVETVHATAGDGDAVSDEWMAEGLRIYEANCLSCHQADGAGIPGMVPAISGSPVVNGPVDDHINLILNGKPPLMSSFRNVLTPAQVAAVVTYQRNALGNSTGDVVRADQVGEK